MQNKRIRYEVESQADGTADIVTDRILLVEVFAGSAKLSKAADNRGFRVLAVWTIRTTNIDLSMTFC